ncbi:MAG: hypothetical protein ACO1SX_24990 [Actinomycetota bacterium]
MAQLCRACVHRDHDEIDKAILAGVPVSEVARRFSMSSTSLQRHAKNHLVPELRKASLESAEPTLLDQLAALQRATGSILAKAEQTKEPRLILAAIREARANLELECRVTGAIKTGGATVTHNTLNLALSPEYLQLRERLITALLPFPEARAAVLSALASGPDTPSLPAVYERNEP